MPEPPELLELAAEEENLPQLLEFMRTRIHDGGFDDGTAGKLELAVEEMLVNVVHYAYPESSGTVSIAAGGNDAGAFVIEISDRGIPFDPLAAPEADTSASIEDRAIGGLGIYFMRKVVHDVRYRREDGRNILTLIMRAPEGTHS